MDLPIALKCTGTEDGKQKYTTQRTLYNGRIIVWRSGEARTEFYNVWRTALSLILERGMGELPLTWEFDSIDQMESILATYPSENGDLGTYP